VPSIWVAELRVSERTAEKLSSKHGLSTDEVRQAVVCVSGLQFSWNDHPQRGIRAIIRTRVNERDVLVVLYPVSGPIEDVWNLGSAYEI
jgi:hypothetical protein